MSQIADVLAITGIGCISGLGIGKAAFDRALFEGRTALAPVTEFDTGSARSHLAGHIADFYPSAFIHPSRLRRIDRVGQLAVACCRLALEDAGFGVPPLIPEPHRVGVALGTATAGLHSLVGYLDRLIAHGPPGASALDFSNTVGNAAASLCGLEFGLSGVNVTLSQREASAFAAASYAANALLMQRSRAIVTGAADDFEPLFLAVHEQFGALATDTGHGEASRPFDRRRNGLVLGNGAFLVVMEKAESATARAQRSYGSVAGIGATSSSCRPNGWPADPAELTRCMREALARAELGPSDISVVFASANSTDLDRTEAAALAEVFGPHGVPVVSLKGALGECSATGAAGLIGALLSFEHGVIPPTVGFEMPDIDCPVDVSSVPRPLADSRMPKFALVNGFASGGANYSIVVRS